MVSLECKNVTGNLSCSDVDSVLCDRDQWCSEGYIGLGIDSAGASLGGRRRLYMGRGRVVRSGRRGVCAGGFGTWFIACGMLVGGMLVV